MKDGKGKPQEESSKELILCGLTQLERRCAELRTEFSQMSTIIPADINVMDRVIGTCAMCLLTSRAAPDFNAMKEKDFFEFSKTQIELKKWELPKPGKT